MREFRQIAATRGFWVLLLTLPIVIAGTQVATSFVRPPPGIAYSIVDETGKYAPEIDRRIELNYQRQVLNDLSAYVQRWDLSSAAPDAPWAGGQRYYSDTDIDAFIKSGGLDAALKVIDPKRPKEAAAFDDPARAYVKYALPADVPTTQGPEALGKAVQPIQEKDIVTDAGKMPLSLVVYLPKDFGQPGVFAQMWTSGRPNQGLIETVRAELTRLMRNQALEASGLEPQRFAQIAGVTAPIRLTAPAQGQGRDRVRIRSILPLALVYLLLTTVMVTGGLMLQGVIEERSNKLLEAIVACIRPGDLMYGKLLGLGAIGLTIIVVWIGFAIAAAFSMPGMVADLVRPALTSLDQPWMIAALIFYFISGYLIISMIYLAIGALSNSLQDAQAYLMPVIFLIMLPTVYMMISVMTAPDSLMPRIMSWIPLYTPFAMLGRLGGGVDLLEVLGTGAMLVVFIILEMWALGKLFQSRILNTGQPPKFLAFLTGKKKAKAA
jgi:ABC-type Na+ efflux pump permease subunit